MNFMNPYLTAFHKYEEADREVSWTDALDFHFQHGAVISTPELFVMARPVALTWSFERQTGLYYDPLLIRSSEWHVWACAGDLRTLLKLATKHYVHRVTYQRHGQQKLRQRWIYEMINKI